MPNILPPRVPFIESDGRTVSREWYRYLYSVSVSLGGAAGVIPVSSGGTGLSSGTSGGVLFFDSSTSIQSSAELQANQIVFGGGAGTSPSTPLAGTIPRRVLLSGGVGALPQWTNYTIPVDSKQGDLLFSVVNEAFARLPKSTASTRSLCNTGTDNNPQWDQVNLTTGVTGELLATNVLQAHTYSRQAAEIFKQDVRAGTGVTVSRDAQGFIVNATADDASSILSQRTFAAAPYYPLQDQGVLMNQVFGA